MSVRAALIVGLGGFLGSMARFLASSFVATRYAGAIGPNMKFPIGTLAVNVTGCFLIGILAGWANGVQPLGTEARLFIFAGLLGGFTTFSAFGYETVELMRVGAWTFAALNVSVQLLGGLIAVWAGLRLFTVIQ